MSDGPIADAAPRTRTRLTPEFRREQILGTAVDAFSGSDYSEVSLDDIAELAGVTRGLLHHYFGSKRALYLEVIARTVTIPPSTKLVPDDATGSRDEILGQCVTTWMNMIESVGGVWAGVAGSGSATPTDVDEIVMKARDDLVERMINEVPFPATLDRDLLRSALRAYSAFARVATDEWLVRRTLRRDETHALLASTLASLVDSAVPAMGATGRSKGV